MSCIVYITGATGSGKSTFASRLSYYMNQSGYPSKHIDHDELRTNANDYEISEEANQRQIERIK